VVLETTGAALGDAPTELDIVVAALGDVVIRSVPVDGLGDT